MISTFLEMKRSMSFFNENIFKLIDFTRIASLGQEKRKTGNNPL